MAYEVLSKDELMHHGILGMKWGVRRYQNQDGSLTAEGRRRYLSADYLHKEAKKDYKLAKKSKNTEAAEVMSKAVEVTRHERDKEYTNYLKSARYERGKSLTEEGKTKTSVIAKGVGEQLLLNAAITVGGVVVGQLLANSGLSYDTAMTIAAVADAALVGSRIVAGFAGVPAFVEDAKAVGVYNENKDNPDFGQNSNNSVNDFAERRRQMG